MTIDMNDPFAVASNPTPREYYGQMDCDAAFVVLQKGVRGGVPFNADIHDPQSRKVSITMTLSPLPEMNMQRPIVRDMLDNDQEWFKFTMPSMKALQIPTGRELNGRWVKCILVNTREVPTSGGTFQKTAFKLLAVYADEQACRDDYAKAHGGNAHSAGGAGATAQPADADKEKQTAALFLAALLKPEIESAATPAQATARAGLVIEKNALLKKHFTVHSPEVAAAVAAKFGAQAPVVDTASEPFVQAF